MSARLALAVLILAAGPAAAEWRFNPRAGVGGEAFVFNGEGARLSVECQGDGLPSVAISPDPRSLARVGARVETTAFRVLFDDDDPVDLAARCYGAGERSVCVAEPGLWTAWDLVDALRGKRRIRIAHEGGLSEWTLIGSNRAIQSLRSCLTP